MSRIATIIPAHNAARFIGATLASVAASGSDRIIVSLDRCTDDTEAIARAAGALVTVSLLPGEGAARNQGALLARDCDFLHFVDADDLVRPGAARILSRAFFVDRAVVAAYGNIRRIDAEGGPYGIGRVVATQPSPAGRILKRLLMANVVCCPAAILVSRPAFDALGGFRTEMTNALDWHMWTRLATLGTFVHVRDIVADYRTHVGSVSLPPVMRSAPYLATLEALFADDRITRAVDPEELKALKACARAGIFHHLASQEIRHGAYLRAAKWFLRSAFAAPALVRRHLAVLEWIFAHERPAARAGRRP